MFQNLLKYLTKHVSLPSYDNEYDAMLYVLTAGSYPLRNVIAESFLRELESKTAAELGNATQMMDRSKRYREQGNREFKSKPCDTVRAIRLYTEAVCSAPKGSEHLALAHANRGMALQAFGYYKQAYDDCACALSAGYPENMRVKIIMRQAHCALKLGDAEKVLQHVTELSTMKLNDNFEKDLQEVRAGLDSITAVLKEDDPEVDFNPSKAQCKTYIKDIAGRGRGVVAKESISENELIFEDRAVAFVPVAKRKSLCQQCAAAHIIPFPCDQCYGRVAYCSLECRHAHADVHALECAGYKIDLFEHIGLLHLAFRATITQIPEIVTRLGSQPDAEAIWKELVPPLNILNGSAQPAQMLNLVTHIEQMDSAEIANYGAGIQVLIVYLRKYTDFQRLFDATKAGAEQWELIVASLMLRILGQLTVNASTVETLCTLQDDFSLLAEGLWLRPQHLKMGQLNKFSHTNAIFSAIFPYLSVCNHSCEISFVPKYSGRYVRTYANAAIKANEEIFNSYTPGCRRATVEHRQRILKETFKFDCKCAKCTEPRDSEEYYAFHRQRCQYQDCGKTFVAKIDGDDAFAAHSQPDSIVCTACDRPQPHRLIDNVMQKLQGVSSVSVREDIFRCFDHLGSYYPDHNEIRSTVGSIIALDCIRAHVDGSPLTDVEFEKLEQIIKFLLDVKEKKSGLASIEYVSCMTYLWDLYALRKQQIPATAMEPMLNVSLLVLPDELKVMFLNYYNDYLKPLVE